MHSGGKDSFWVVKTRCGILLILMDEKTLLTLEYFKILDQLAARCEFSASAEKARGLRPTTDIHLARLLQAQTSEAVLLRVTRDDISIGGARDVRAPVDLANHGGVLDPGDLLEIKYTLIAARNLARVFERLSSQCPNLFEIVQQMPNIPGVIDSITRAISDRGEVLDSASDKLATIRRDLRVVHDRLMARLQKMVSDPHMAPYLQEALVTQRDGRYVIPLRSEFKGRIKSIVHDQSASGATLFVEPLPVVEANNQFRELQLAERNEVHRILAELSRQVAENGVEILRTVDVVSELDLILARAKYSEYLAGIEPKLHNMNPRPPHPGCLIRLYQARHPLLNPETVVPIDVELDDETYGMVITGPNTGGKTVTLKTIGLLVLMAQSGLHIPTHSGSEINIFQSIYADIGDEQSIEQSLSTFSGHITNIIRILEQADTRSLVILDELGAGTDPTEGSALARAILSHLLQRGIAILVTTHHPELKAFAHSTPGIVNASVEFSLETLRPTYHLTIGLPGRSNALAIATRLGLPNSIIEDARSELSPDDLRAEDLLNEIHHQREVSRQQRSAAEKARKEADALRRELFERLDKIEDERRKLLEESRQQAAAQVEALQGEIAETRRALARARQPMDVLESVAEKAEELQEIIEVPVERQALEMGPELRKVEQARRRSIRLGDKVRLRALGAPGVVIALAEEEAEVQVGVMRVRTRLADLELWASEPEKPIVETPPLVRSVERPAETERSSAAGRSSSNKRPSIDLSASPGLELDLRGKRADEALDELERYLDAAYLAGLPFVRIIHGKGTGKLRDVVREFLNGHTYVRSSESGSDKEGGDGVTVVKLANG